MAYLVRMPKLGMEMQEGVLLEWRVEEGDAVEAEWPVAEIESEKSTTEVTAREAGVLRRKLLSPGEAVEPGAPMGVIAGPSEDITDLLAAAEAGADDADPEGRVDDWLDGARELLSEFDERGTTIGAKEFDGSHILELPVASFSNVKPFEELILFTLGEHGEFESVSELAGELARELGEEYTDSFRSKVIYNVDRLGPGGKGYIEREEHGKSYRTRLSRIGELWVRAHSDERNAANGH